MKTPYLIAAARSEAEAHIESSFLMHGHPVSAEYSVFLLEALQGLGGEVVEPIPETNEATVVGDGWCVELF